MTVTMLDKDPPHPSPSMSLKQLYQTVRKGQKITFLIFDGDPVTGYLAGIDDLDYFVLVPGADPTTFRQLLVSRSGCPQREIHSESTFEGELLYKEMERIVGPFRTWIVNQIKK